MSGCASPSNLSFFKVTVGIARSFAFLYTFYNCQILQDGLIGLRLGITLNV